MSGRNGLVVGQVVLVGLFVTALVTAQLTASKLLLFQIPVSVPVAGASLVLPGAALAYALTFFASDCYAELYGKRAAQVLVNVGFGMNFVMLALVYSTIAAPAVPEQAVAPSTYATVLSQSANITLGSLVAYVVAQNWDVVVFHRIREWTDGRHLWLRNLASTASSQAIDTVLFVFVGFVIAPSLLGIGQPTPVAVAVSLVVGQYVLKLLIAVLDTPLVYGVVAAVESFEEGNTDPTVTRGG